MNGNSIRIGASAKWTMGALALATASVSYASSNTLVGGGSTLPVIAYAGDSINNPVYPAGVGSVFGVFSAQAGNPSVSYCKTSDAIALNVLTGSPGFNVQDACPANGFGAGTVGRADLTQPNYVVLGSPLNASDYLDYQNSHPAGDYPVEFPAIAGAIAIAFNLTDSLGNQVTSSEVNFTDGQICSIFSGQVTNWSDPRLTSAFTLTDGASIPANPINVQYRSDGNGTSFSFSSHLATVCGTINNEVFETSRGFTSVVANFFPLGLPPNWVGSSSDATLIQGIGSTSGSIGYVETANALATIPSPQLADVNGKSPLINFGNPLTITAVSLLYNEVISNVNNANGTAAVETIGAIPGVTNPPTTQCIALVKPSLYAKPAVPGGIVPSTSYPIVAISYLLANSEGNTSTDLMAIRGLLTAPYTSSITSQVTTVGPGTGLAFLTLGSNAFTTNQIRGCLVN